MNAQVLAIALFAFFCALTMNLSSALPAPEAAEDFNIYDDLVSVVAEQPERADRHARATCDLLSIATPWITVNHAACAAHCLAMRKGYRGGRCIDGVCNCRK